jgi:hypothetical protein
MSRADRNPWLAEMKLPQINEEWSIFLLQACMQYKQPLLLLNN